MWVKIIIAAVIITVILMLLTPCLKEIYKDKYVKIGNVKFHNPRTYWVY